MDAKRSEIPRTVLIPYYILFSKDVLAFLLYRRIYIAKTLSSTKWHAKKNDRSYGKNRVGAVCKNLWNLVTRTLAKTITTLMKYEPSYMSLAFAQRHWL